MAIPRDAVVAAERGANGQARPPVDEAAASGDTAGGHQQVVTPDGVEISVREWGHPGGREILFIHGLAQCHLSFLRQFDSALASEFRLVAYDLRGHGESAKPLDPVCYRDGRRWADEVAAVIDAKRLRRPVLVGWSLGGRVLRQYLLHYGDRRLAGINIVSARPLEDPSILGSASQADLAARPTGLAERIRASAAFLRACFARQPSEAEFAFALAYNMIVPQEVREAIGGWSTDIELTRAAFAQGFRADPHHPRTRRPPRPPAGGGADRGGHPPRANLLVRRLRAFALP